MDLSKFRQNYTKDSAEDIQEIASSKMAQQIPEGVHEVVIVGIHEKDGVKFKINDKLGGTLGFSIIVRNAQKQEQMIYMSIPLQLSFKTAASDLDKKLAFPYKSTVQNLYAMGIDAAALRESILLTNGESAELLKGAQFVITNSWNSKMIHMEYDAIAKAHFFVTAMGDRFDSGEMAIPLYPDTKLALTERYKEFIGLAKLNGYQLATRMDMSIEKHLTATNQAINEELRKICQPKEVKTVVNKTIPPVFPIHVKKPIVQMDVEPDIEF